MGEEESSGKRVSKWDEMPNLENLSRKEKRKCLKKMKRKMLRKEAAEKEKALEESLLNDSQYQLGLRLQEQQEAEASEKARQDYEEHEKTWLLNYQNAILQHEHEEQQKQKSRQTEEDKKSDQEEGDWEYVEDGPAEIIWQGNEIIVKKNKIKVPKQKAEEKTQEDLERPFSNPLPPQHDAFAEHKMHLHSSVGETVFNEMEQQIPNFGTEQDKAHCPFHIKTGACRFGDSCSRTHFSPDKSCTLLMRNMYNGPGLSWEQDEGLEYTEEEVDSHYLEFYEDVHTEFLKFGQLVNFKVCRNSSAHLRGNVYVHYRSLESAISARNAQNGRHFAGKMVTCEFVGVTRWKVAICGEYKKTGHKSCSRGSACNFLHCFRNPGGEYDWADWDRDPPRSWQEQMHILFGGSRDGHHVERNIKEHGLNTDRYNDRYSRSIRNKTSSGNNNFKEKESQYVAKLKQRQKCFHDGYRSSSDDEGCWTPNIDTYCDARVRHHQRERSSTEHSMDRYRHRDRRDKLSYKKGKLKEYDSWSRDERKQKQKDFLDSRSVSGDEENLKLDIDMLLVGSGAYHGGEQSHRENDERRCRQRSRSQGKESSVEDSLEEKGFLCINERRRRKVLSDGKRTNSADETDLLLDMDKADLKWLKPNKKESSYGKGYQEKSRILEVDISGGDREAKTLFDPSSDTDVYVSKKWHQSGNACTESYVSKNNSDYDSKADEYTLEVGDTYVLEDTKKSPHNFGIEISRESKKRSEAMKNSDNMKSYKENQCHETSLGKQSSRYDERHNLNNNEHFGGDKCSPSSHGKYMDRKRSLPKSTSESVSRKRRKHTSSSSKRTPEEVSLDCFDRWQASD